MKQSLQLKVSQRLTLTPRESATVVIRLLQLSTLDCSRKSKHPVRQPDAGARRRPSPTRCPAQIETPSNSDAPSRPRPRRRKPAATTTARRQPGVVGLVQQRLRATTTMYFDRARQYGGGKKPCASICWINWPNTRCRRPRVVTFLIEGRTTTGISPNRWKNWPPTCRKNWASRPDELQVGLRLLQQFEPAGGGRAFAGWNR